MINAIFRSGRTTVQAIEAGRFQGGHALLGDLLALDLCHVQIKPNFSLQHREAHRHRRHFFGALVREASFCF